jgi:hypothetical protein
LRACLQAIDGIAGLDRQEPEPRLPSAAYESLSGFNVMKTTAAISPLRIAQARPDADSEGSTPEFLLKS